MPLPLPLHPVLSDSSPIAQELVLEVLQALTSNTQIVKETIQKGLSSGESIAAVMVIHA